MEDKLYKAWQSAGKYYDLPDYDTFKEDMKDESKLHRFHESLGKYYDVPDYDTFKADMWGTAVEQQPTGQADAPAGQTTSAGEMVAQNGGGAVAAGMAGGVEASRPIAQQTPEQELQEFTRTVHEWNPQSPEGYAKGASGNYGPTRGDQQGVYITPESQTPEDKAIQERMSQVGEAYEEPDVYSFEPESGDGKMHYSWRNGRRIGQLDPGALRFAHIGRNYSSAAYKQAEQEAAGMSDEQLKNAFNKLYAAYSNSGDDALMQGYGRDDASRMMAYATEMRYRDVGMGHASDYGGDGQQSQTGVYHYHAARMNPAVATEMDAQDKMGWEKRVSYLSGVLQDKRARENAINAGVNTDEDVKALELDRRKLLAGAMLYARDNHIYPEDAYRMVVGAANNATPKETGFLAGFASTTSQMWRDAKYFFGEAANLIANDRGDVLDAISALDKYGDEADTKLLAGTLHNLGLLGMLIFDGDEAEASEGAGRILSECIVKDKDGRIDVDATRAALMRKLQTTYSWGDRTMRDNIYNTAMAKQTEGDSAWWGQQMAQIVPQAAAVIVGVTTKNPAAAQAIGQLGMGYMCISSGSQAMQEARMYGASDSEVWTAGIVNAVLEYAFEKVPFDRYTKRVFGEVKATSAHRLMEAVADVNHPAHHEIQQLLEAARKELGNGKLAKAYAGDVIAEGSSEAVTGMLQKASEILYKNPEDYPTFMEILEEGVESAKGGAAMGGVMGAVSTGTTKVQADNRRRKAGVVSVGIYENEDGMGVPVEIIDHDSAGNYVVLDGQHNELIVAPGKLTGVTTYTYDEWKRGEVQYEDAQAQAGGYNAQGKEREQVQDDLQRAEQRLDELDFDLSSFEGWTSEAFEERIASGEHDYTDEDIEAIRDYFRAKAASDGMQQRVEDDIDAQVQQASDLVDKQTNQGTGMVHRAVLNNGQEVYVTGGQLVMTGDGTMVDTEASDESLFVYNPVTGQPEQYTPQDFQSVDDPVNPEQLKSEAASDIRQAIEQQAESDMNGYVQQGGVYDMVDEQGTPMHGTVLELRPDNTAVVQVDGQQIPVAIPTQQLQSWVDNAKQMRMSVAPSTLPSRNAGQQASTGTGAAQNAAIPQQGAAQVPAQSQAPALPMDEKTGEPIWSQTKPEEGYNYLIQSGLDADEITSLIDDRIAQADADIAKASKGGTIDQRLQARKAKDYWEAVNAMNKAAQAQPVVTSTAASQSPTGQGAPAGAVRVEARDAETMPVGNVAVNPDGTRADDRGQLGIRREDTEYFLRTMSPRMMGLLDKVAKSLGWKIRLYNGENANERGHYDNNVVWVNRRAMTSKLAQWILGHEMTHGMATRTRRGGTFNDYVELACEHHRRQVGNARYEQEVQGLIKAYQEHLAKNGYDPSTVDRAYIEEEIACDVTGDLLMNNPEMIGKLFSGVENPGRVKRIIDMIVDFLDWVKSKLPWRSEERQAFDDLINRLNNLYRDAKAQTDIAKATASEEGSRIESGEGEREGSSFSITGNAEGSGFTCSETVCEVWRVPQEDGTYKEEEHWVKKPLLDSEGNVVFRMGDKEFSAKNPITIDDLKSNPDTVLNYMLADALRAGTIDETKADQVRQQYADMLNLYLEKGVATEDGNGFENLEKKWLWVGETVFRTVASNSDEQYSYSIDITKVCKKNEAVIRAISAMQVKTGYGVTPAQILEIYETTDAEGFQVPCPVCYVFSRYINNGKYATAIVNGMKKYGKYLPGQPDAKPVEWWVKEFKDAQARAEKMETPLKHANEDVKIILQQIDTLCREITSGKLSAEEAESKRRHVRALDQRYRAALDVISQEALSRWIKAFVIEGSDQGGWSLREDAALPEDMDDFTLHALDIRKTASAMEKYPSLTRYRRAGGSAGGKEITFASNNELGTIIMGLGISKDNLDDYPNYYQLAAEAATEEERQAYLKSARDRFDKAMLYVQRQTLRGGQRMWSWSDNIESLSSDVASNLMQLELLGGALQTYSKQLEGVKMVAAMNGYVNASLMGYADGIREVGPDEIDDNGRLKDHIWDVNNKGRRRIIANAGSPVYHNEADGKDYVLVFDDVVGIDPFGRDGKRGLFSLNEEYDRAGNILVGMNDIHVRAAMADPRVFFIIPWHASGMSNHILKQMFNILGVNMDQFVSTDYTKMQEETNYLLKKKDGSPKKKVPKEVEDFWDSHTFEDEFPCGTGHIENGDRQGGLSESQLHYRALRDAIFDGTAKDNEGMMKEIMADEFLSQVYRQVTTHVADGKMTEKDKEFIYPYEYWDETSTVENADINGRRYVEYCRRMGFKPKFTGKFDDKTGYSPEGNFADDPGYWKLLIDRRMYDRRGNYQGLTAVDSSGLDSSMYDPDQTQEEFNVTDVATNEGAEKIAETVYQNDIERTGTMPTPNLDLTMDKAVAKYNEVTALQASLIKAEREALKAAEEAKVKVEKAKEKEAQDVDGRKAKSVSKAKESARKAMDVAKQKAREVEEIASKFGDNKKDAGARFSLSTEIAARYPNWMDNQVVEDEGENKERGQNTQIPGTIGTYKKVADWIEKNLGKDVRVLDASSGLGRGTIELQQRGFNVEDIEPYPGKGRKQQPTYGGVDAYQRAMDDGKQYDFIISNAVLNVIPDDWRRGVLHDMATLLAPGGKMFINTRKTSEVKNVKNKIELESPYELLVGTPEKITSYQRFFTPKELKEYVERELGDGFTVEIARPANSGTNGLAAVVVTKTGDSAPRFSIDQGAKLAPQYQKATYEEMASGLIPFNGKLRRGQESKFKVVDDDRKVFDNWYGTRQKRYKNNVGKEMGAGIYVHKDYAGDIVPADVLDKAKAIAEREGIEYKIVYYEPKKPNMVRLDEAPDFDTAREPIPGKWTWVDTETGELGKTGNSKQIWHNKWMWVKDDYKGFDVDEAYEWSKTWNQEISKPDGWSYKWDYLLDQAGLPKDWTGSALSEELNRPDSDGPGGGKSIDSVVAEAEQMTETNPTDGQKESGNYKKGHVKVDGFDISIEQPKGSIRSGVDADGNEWSQEMHNTYGYIRGTEGVDGDHIDVFLSDHLDDWNGNVYVVDQVNKDRSFDEHKVMYGFNSEQEARDAYLSNYEEGWTGLGNITGVSREEFKKWVDSSHRKNKPFAEYKNVKPLQSTGTGDLARFSISETRTDEDGREVYTETRDDGTKDREVVTMPDGSREVTWFDETGRKKEKLDYFPNGEVRQVSNYDSDGDLTRLIQYDENRRAIRHWEPRIGTDWERDENGVTRGMSNGVEIRPYGSRFSINITPKIVTDADTEEIQRMHRVVDEWATQENYDEAKGKDPNEIFNSFGNDLEPINYVPEDKLGYVGMGLKDNRAYCGKGYFVDHMVNHHPNIAPDRYQMIMDVISHPEAIKETFVTAEDGASPVRSVVFLKTNDDRINAVVVRLEETKTGEMKIFYKSLFDQKKRKKIYKNIPDLWNETEGENKNVQEVTINTPDGPVTFKTLEKEKSLGSGGTPISHAAEAAPASNRLSGPNDLSGGKDNTNSLPDQGNSKNRAKNFDEGAETTGNGGEERFSVGVPNMPASVKDYEGRHEIKRWDDLVSNITQHYKNRDIAALKRDRDAHANNAKYWARQLKINLKNGFDDNDGFIKDYRAWVDMHNALSEYAKAALDDMTKFSWRNRNWGVKRNQSITMDEMDKMFAEHNTDSVNKDLWGRVMEVSRQLGVDDIKFKKAPKGVSGRILGGRVRFDDEYFNDPAYSDNDKCVTMLHEMIHHVTVYAIKHPELLNDVQKAAVEELHHVYRHIANDPSFFGMYGIKNVKEMVAELANPRFREALRKKNLWQRAISSIRKIFLDFKGKDSESEQTDAYRAVLSSFTKLLENFNADAYNSFAEEARQYRPRFSLEPGETAAGVTLFSGGGLIEAGLRGVVDPRAAVEFDKKISGVYRDNHGNHIVTADVRDVDPMELAKQVDGPVEYFHASPVCKNFSVLKNGGEKPLDIETAQSTANAIEKMQPRIVTIENVANYQRSDALKIIAEKLDELGYTHDIHIVDAADYGAATHRRRLILRAVAPGNELPAFPEGDKKSFTPWFDRVVDLIADLPETNMPDWMTRRLANDGIYWKSIEQPLIVMSSGAAYGGIGHAFADDAAPTIAAGRTGDRIVMPDGKVYKVTGRVLARLMGLPDSYKLPQSESLAHTVLGNGVPVELTRGVIGPLVKEVAQPSTPRFSLAPTFYSNAAKAVEGVKQNKATAEQWKAMLTKAGGIKAGEDKWMGLSQWLDEHKGQTLTKEEVAQFVADNGIEMEEVNYGGVKFVTQDNGTVTIEGHPEIEMRPVAGTGYYDYYYDGNKVARVASLEVAKETARNDIVDDEHNRINPTRERYTTNGLENNREIAFVVPNVEPYQEHDEIHFGPENEGRAVMWVRFGETTDTDGNRVLVIDEIQSNRHQDAREKGYRDPAAFERETQQRGSREAALRGLLRGEFKITGVPAAPFEKNWHEVAMKRMLRLAAEEGFDKVAWTTGEQQAERYDLRKQVTAIVYKKLDDGTYRVSAMMKIGGARALGDLEENHLADAVGKELSQKIIKGDGVKTPVVPYNAGWTSKNTEEWTALVGNDLKIGGEGMKGFYDQMLPRFMDKYGKRWGVKVGEVTLDTPGRETMHSVDVTPEMRRSVMENGQPLFSLSLGAPYQGSKGQIATRVVDALPGGRRFVDLFAGGGAVTHAAMLSGKYGEYRMNDINPAGLELFLKGINGDYRDYVPKEMSAEEFKAIKGTPEGLMLSYGGLGRNVDPDKDSVARRVRRVQRLEDLKGYADQVESSNSDYRDVELEPGDVVYADIPYEGTNKTGYRGGSKFDKAAFSKWGLAQDVPVYVSEQSMPKGWVEVASWEMPSMNAQKKRGEKLFVQERFASDDGRRSGRVDNATYGDNTDARFSLTDEQREAQIHSANFKRWFGDWENDPEHASKVVDAEGKPLVVWHGGHFGQPIEDYDTYTWDADGAGGWFSANKEYSNNYSGVIPTEDGRGYDYLEPIQVYLNIRNPFEMGDNNAYIVENGKPTKLLTDIANRLGVDEKTITDMIDWDFADSDKDAPLFTINRTKAFADLLKENGYDGAHAIEFGNDTYMITEPHQIKSATENNGDFSRENPDIRYSLSEDTQKIFDTAKRKFGETKDIREAGYVLPDGTMLDFSGRHEMDPGSDSSHLAGSRHTDHRAINQIDFVYDENGDEVDTGVKSDMPDFIKRGAIRIDANNGLINLSVKPTAEQRKVLHQLVAENGGTVDVDFGDGWDTEHSVYYDNTKPAKVLGDIDRYFDEGIKPESNIRFSLSGDGTVEEYNKAVNMTGRTFNVGGREVKPGITRYNFQEAFQDAILAVKKLQQVVEHHFGIKLPTRENAWMYENRLSSINMHERKSFIDKVYEPMMKIADAIMKRGVKEKELNAYLICKHGLERNQVFAARDAQAEADEIARNGGTPDMQQLIDKYRQRDYSGLTGVTGIEGDIADIEAEAQRIVDEFEQKHGRLCNELWDAIRKATQWSLRKSYQSGMMSAATFNHVSSMFQYYIPLRGWSETTAEDVYSYMMGEHGAFNGVLKKAEGRTSVADDPLATIGNMAESALMQGNKNLLKQHLLRMAQNHPTDVCQVRDVWLVEGPGGVWEPHWPNIPDDATPDEIDQILQDHENDMLQLEAGGGAKRVRNNLDIPYRIDPRHVPEHAVVAKVAGIDHVVYINGNPRAAQAINGQTGAGRGTKSGFSRLIDFVFGDLKRFYSSVLTSLNINFSGANFVRDLPHAYAMTFIKYGPLKAAEYIGRSFQVIPWVFKNQFGKTGTSQMDRYFQEFLASGAVTGYAHINDVDAWKANNKRRWARLSALGKARVAVPRALGEVINAIGWFSETLELIPRFTAFLVERRAGKDIATATKAAKDITTNFNKKGSEVTPGVWGAVANTLRYMKMFFNPIVQGMYQFVDVASQGKENKMIGPRMVLATMHLPVLGAIVPYLNQFLLEALGGDDDDDYWLINEYTRRNNVCIFTGNGYLKIPIAPVFREMYGMGEVVATRHAGKADNEKTAIDLIDQLRTMGSVEGQSSYNEWSLARFLLPEHFAPLIDVMNNENFTGGPIYYDNNYKEYAPEYTKAKKSTWSPLVAASKWLNEMMGGDEDIAADNSGKWMNPAVWQHLITNVGGGFAQLAGDVVSGITDITEGKEIDASNMPVLKRFYSNSSDERAQWARFGIYKDFEKDYTLAKEKYQALDKRGLSLTERADEMVKFAESHPKAAAIYAVWEGGIKGADIPARLEKLGKDDPAYWDLVKEAVGKAEKAMNSGYVRAWEQKRKDRPDSMSDKELNERFDGSDNDSIRHIMADEISKRAGSQDYYGRDAQATWSDKSVAAWEAYQSHRTSDDIKADAELSNLMKVDENEKDKSRAKMLGYIKDELNKIRRGKDATSRSAGVKGLGEGDDERVMNELRAARKQLIEDLKNGSAEQAYRNLERRTMRLGLRKKAKEL